MTNAALKKLDVERVKTRHGSYYVLKDGRRIAIPPAGGKVKRRDISQAVQTVVEKRLAKA